MNLVRGFNPAKITHLQISDKDSKSLGIEPKDFAKVDVNGDGIINSSEFLSKGMGYSSIFNAFKAQAEPIGAYVENGNENVEKNQSSFHTDPSQAPALKNNLLAQQLNAGNPKGYNLNHPNLSNHAHLAQNIDIIS